MSYSNTFGRMSYFINYAYNRNVQSSGQNENSSPSSDSIISLTVSIPFGADISASYNMNSSRVGDTTHSLGLNGSAFADRSLNWNVQEGYNASDKSTSGNINLNYQAQKVKSPPDTVMTATAPTIIIRYAVGCSPIPAG